MYTLTGLLVTAAPVAVTCTVPQVAAVHPENEESEEPAGGVQMLKLLTPPGLLRFQVPAQIAPDGEMSANCKLELAYVYELTLSVPPSQLYAVGDATFPVCPHASEIPVVSGCSVTYTTWLVVMP